MPLLAAIGAEFNETITIIWTAYYSDTAPTREQIENMKKCMRSGAHDYISKREEQNETDTYRRVVDSAKNLLREREHRKKGSDTIARDEKLLRSLKEKGQKEYRGLWVAVYDGQIVNSAKSRIRLIAKLAEEKDKASKENIQWIEPIIIKFPGMPAQSQDMHSSLTGQSHA